MHKVIRNEAPISLIEYNKEYLKDKSYKYNWENFSNRKAKQDTLQNLKQMYNGCCAYCEGFVESVAYLEIEHFRPKSIFPRLMFEYNNLHYSCPICNKNKADKWEEWFISPTDDEPEEHIRFNGYMAEPIDLRGSEMIKMLGLNIRAKQSREELYNDMKDIWSQVLESYEKLDKEDKKKVIEFKKQFKKVIEIFNKKSSTGKPYCTMLKHNFKNKFDKLKTEVEKL